MLAGDFVRWMQDPWHGVLRGWRGWAWVVWVVRDAGQQAMPCVFKVGDQKGGWRLSPRYTPLGWQVQAWGVGELALEMASQLQSPSQLSPWPCC